MSTITFILVNPGVPENIGFVCRSIKTMGFSSLRLVNPESNHTHQGAKNTAYESHDILDNAKVFSSLKDALQDVDFTIGTTAKERRQRYSYLTPDEIPDLVISKKDFANHFALVFGSENDGLSKDDIELCDTLSHVPMATTYPSLNLSHSVALYAYALSKTPTKSLQTEFKKTPDQKILLEKTHELLLTKKVDKQPVLFNRIMERVALCNKEDSGLILSLLRYLKNN